MYRVRPNWDIRLSWSIGRQLGVSIRCSACTEAVQASSPRIDNELKNWCDSMNRRSYHTFVRLNRGTFGMQPVLNVTERQQCRRYDFRWLLSGKRQIWLAENIYFAVTRSTRNVAYRMENAWSPFDSGYAVEPMVMAKRLFHYGWQWHSASLEGEESQHYPPYCRETYPGT